MIKSIMKEKYKTIFDINNKSIGAILMLHRVDRLNNEGIWFNQHLKISEETLSNMIDYARKKRCTFVSLDTMYNEIKLGGKQRRMISISFDDGYKDNFENAFPILLKKEIPFTIFVCTSLVQNEMLLWWDDLEQLILSNDSLEIDGIKYYCNNKTEKEEVFLQLRKKIILLNQNEINPFMRRMSNGLIGEFENVEKGLTLDQISEMNKSGLCTIGNHTYSHKSFSGCTDENIIQDIEKAQDFMKKELGIEMKHFAFPFGDKEAVTEYDKSIISQCGFRTALTTEHGFICKSTDLNRMPRIFITESNWKEMIDRISYCC